MLKIENLSLRKDEREILKNINLTINKGEIHALLGRNGTGKTSLAYTIMGCGGYKPYKGKIIFEGVEITNLSIFRRAKLGITLAWQKPASFEGLTVREYLECGKKNSDVYRLLSMVGLSSDYLNRRVNEDLSGGERKRIELASVMATDPKFAILDEIDSGIDTPSLPFIRKTIQKMRESGVTVLLITHSEDTLDIADKASLMGAGEVLKTSSPKKVKEFFIKHYKNAGVFIE